VKVRFGLLRARNVFGGSKGTAPLIPEIREDWMSSVPHAGCFTPEKQISPTHCSGIRGVPQSQSGVLVKI